MTERPEDAAKRAQDETTRDRATDEQAGKQAGEEVPKEPSEGLNATQSTDSPRATGDGADGEEEDGGDPIQILTKRLSELEQENSELKDQFLRKSADFENFRKRMNREKEEAIAFANRELLEDLLPIIDDFERAIKSAEESKDFDAFLEGVALIEKQFTSMLERKWGLARFDSEGQEFDPQRHEAVTSQEGEPGSSPTVVEDYQKGYLLRDRVLRSAKVKVALPTETNA